MSKLDNAGQVRLFSALAADRFVKVFYSLLDSHHPDIVKMFREKSVVIWDGNASPNLQSISKQLGDLPHSAHVLGAVDCQPIPAFSTSSSGTPAGLLLTATGEVKYNSESIAHGFHHSFVLQLDPQRSKEEVYFVVSMVARPSIPPKQKPQYRKSQSSKRGGRGGHRGGGSSGGSHRGGFWGGSGRSNNSFRGRGGKSYRGGRGGRGRRGGF